MWGGVIGMALVAGLLFWLLRGRTSPAGSREDESDLNYEEKEAADELRRAEEEVRERESSAHADEEQPGDDWGPGTPRSYQD
jgi:hypothetical protein